MIKAERPKFVDFKDEVAWGMDITPISPQQREASGILRRGLGHLSIVRRYVNQTLKQGVEDKLDWKGDLVIDLGEGASLEVLSRQFGSGELDCDHFSIKSSVKEDGSHSDYGVSVRPGYCQITAGWRDDSGAHRDSFWPRQLLDGDAGSRQKEILDQFELNTARSVLAFVIDRP